MLRTLVAAIAKNSSRRWVDTEKRISEGCPITHLNTPTIFEGREGMVGSIIQLQGVAFDTQTAPVLNECHTRFSAALAELNDNIGVYVYRHHRKVDAHLAGTFTSDFARELDTAYHAQFVTRPFYTSDLYLVVCHKGVGSGKLGRLHRLGQRASQSVSLHARDALRQAHMNSLTHVVQRLLTVLKPFGPRLLGEHDHTSSELLTFFGVLLNGGERIEFAFPKQQASVASNPKQRQAFDKRYPNGNITHFISNKRIFIGHDTVFFQGATPEQSRYAAVLSIKQYPAVTASMTLDSLMQVDAEFMHMQCFLVEDKAVASKAVKDKAKQMQGTDSDAKSLQYELEHLKDDVASGRAMLGRHQSTLLVYADTKEALDSNVNQVLQCFSDAKMTAVREWLGLTPVFWSMIPTNIKDLVRYAFITQNNFACFASLHNYHTGYKDKNYLGSAVTLLETPSRTPYFFNTHQKGSKDNPSKGHTLIIGGNNSGKTALCCFLDAQLNRYHGRSYLFDRQEGMKIYAKATNTPYALLSPDNRQTCQFNPLQLNDSKATRQFCKQWLELLLLDETTTSIDGDTREQLSHCIDYGFDTLTKSHRTLTHVVKLLPMDFPYWASLRRWLRANADWPEGPYAYLFDNAKDRLNLTERMGFDMTHFIDHESAAVQLPLFRYLMFRIEQAMQSGSKLTSLFLDEGHQYLNNDYYRQKLKTWMPTIRKDGGHIILPTQSARTILDSGIAHIFLDNCATLVVFPNPQARREDYIEGLHLTETEFLFVAKTPPHTRLMLIKQDNESVIARLNLSGLPKFLRVLSGNRITNRLCDTLCHQYGDEASAWLDEFYRRSAAS